MRVAATAAYSRAWDDRARRELEALLRRAERPTAAERASAAACRAALVRRLRPPSRDDRDAER